MARGSKSVDAKQDAAARDTLHPDEALGRTRNTPAERARRERVASVQMSRTRIMSQLESASNPNYRQTMQRTLSSLDQELEKLAKVEPEPEFDD